MLRRRTIDHSVRREMGELVMTHVRTWGLSYRALEAAGMPLIDPTVWTGGALQEKSVRMEEFGLASMYPAFGWS